MKASVFEHRSGDGTSDDRQGVCLIHSFDCAAGPARRLVDTRSSGSARCYSNAGSLGLWQ